MLKQSRFIPFIPFIPLVAACCTAPAFAQSTTANYPAKPLRLVVGFPAGG